MIRHCCVLRLVFLVAVRVVVVVVRDEPDQVASAPLAHLLAFLKELLLEAELPHMFSGCYGVLLMI